MKHNKEIMLILLAWSTAFLSIPVDAKSQNKQQQLPKEMFVDSKKCQACHNGLISPEDEDISIGVHWRSSMMAHSAKDPYWQASVKRETLVNPAVAEHIQDECAACHMPMARYRAHASGKLGAVFDNLSQLPPKTRIKELAVDGVSCSMCHQISAEKLGEPSSFTAGFVVDAESPPGKRPAYGPYETDKGRERVMRSSTDLVPTESKHIQDSALCGSCHTLYTKTRGEKGEVIGELPEQMPYLEWLHSDYADSESCQSCHMPVVAENTPITSVLGQDRTNVSQHVFLGGNFLMLNIFNRQSVDLKPNASPQELANRIVRTKQHLQNSSASIEIRDATFHDGKLRAKVVVGNLAGHKLPTAYPSRRTWISFQVENKKGDVLFSSGSLNSDGSIDGNDNDSDPDLYEPHYETVSSPEQVQIYEAIMADNDGQITTVLLKAMRYIKDNRILPDGFKKQTADNDIAVQGAAYKDSDFAGGVDAVEYNIDALPAESELTITAKLWYQPIAFRWAQNLMQQPSELGRRFVSYYNDIADRSALVMAHASKKIP